MGGFYINSPPDVAQIYRLLEDSDNTNLLGQLMIVSGCLQRVTAIFLAIYQSVQQTVSRGTVEEYEKRRQVWERWHEMCCMTVRVGPRCLTWRLHEILPPANLSAFMISGSLCEIFG